MTPAQKKEIEAEIRNLKTLLHYYNLDEKTHLSMTENEFEEHVNDILDLINAYKRQLEQ